MIQKLSAGHDANQEIGQSAAALHVVRQSAQQCQIADGFSPPQSVADQPTGQRFVEALLLSGQVLMQPVVSGKLFPVAEHADGFDLFFVAVPVPPAPQRIVILQRKSEGVETGVTVVARRIASMCLKPLADRQAVGNDFVRRDRPRIGRWRRDWRAEDTPQDPVAASDWTGATRS